MKSVSRNFTRLPKTYSGLVALHLPRPIHDKVAYDNAVEVIHALAGHKLNHDQDDCLAIMAKLVEDYESENVPEPKPIKGVDALIFLLEENSLTADHIKKLAIRFAVSADLVLAWLAIEGGATCPRDAFRVMPAN
jgi:antitoxin component HigA of HigAB toxin-antitoxin module